MSQYLQLHFFLSSPSQVSFPFSYYFYNATSKFSPICRNLNCPYQNLQNWHFVVSGKRQPTLKYILLSGLFTCTSQCYYMRGKSTDQGHICGFFILIFSFVLCCALQKCISHSNIFRQQHRFNKFLFSLTRGQEQNPGP